jgi:hypothetical protein
MVGLFIEDPSPEANGKPIRMTYERNETVQRTVIKQFKVDSGEVLLLHPRRVERALRAPNACLVTEGRLFRPL